MRLLTPRGSGGIAVVAVDGPDRHRIVAGLARVNRRPWEPSANRSSGLCTLHVGGRALDQAIVVERSGLARIELHVHGSPAVLDALGRHLGWRPATARPADRLLRHALSEAQLRLALEQLDLDFDGFLSSLGSLPPDQRRRAAAGVLRRTAVARALVEPERLVLCGAQNAGKSTVMNRLLVRERVLAGEQPGLTRDPVRELTSLSGYPYLLVDTAGEGYVTSLLDAAAQERGRRESRGAWRLLIVDGNRGPGPEDTDLVDQRTLVVCNKDDLPQAPWQVSFAPHLRLSCRREGSWAGFRQQLGESLRCRRGLPRSGPVGGVAALDAAQEAALGRALEGDTSC